MNELNTLFDELQNSVNDCQTDVTKFVEGNNSAGTRVIKAVAQLIRTEVQEQKNKQF